MKKTLKSIPIIQGLFDSLCRIITRISPKLNTKFHFLVSFGRIPDLKNPQTLNEKISVLKLNNYNKNKLVQQCADKYEVRQYIKNKGCEDILVPLIAVYDSVDEIEWDKLPNAFAMKWNFGCGFNIICDNKSQLDIEETKQKMRKWGNDKSYLNYAELQYEHIKKRIIVEQYLKPRQGLLPEDYKIYCLNGIPSYIMVCVGRENSGQTKFYYLNSNWELEREMSFDGCKAPAEFSIEKPKCLDELLKKAKILSEDFPFVRTDFYIVDEKIYFGELTFTPSGGVDSGRKKEADIIMGNILNIE